MRIASIEMVSAAIIVLNVVKVLVETHRADDFLDNFKLYQTVTECNSPNITSIDCEKYNYAVTQVKVLAGIRLVVSMWIVVWTFVKQREWYMLMLTRLPMIPITSLFNITHLAVVAYFRFVSAGDLLTMKSKVCYVEFNLYEDYCAYLRSIAMITFVEIILTAALIHDTLVFFKVVVKAPFHKLITCSSIFSKPHCLKRKCVQCKKREEARRYRRVMNKPKNLRRTRSCDM